MSLRQSFLTLDLWRRGALCLAMFGVLAPCLPLAAQTATAATSKVKVDDDDANAPYKVWDSKPAITMQPLLLDVSGNAVVVEWMTDTAADGVVHWGEQALDHTTTAAHDGLVDVGTFHRVVLDGLTPGHSYRYQVASRQVVALKPYWPERGGTAQGSVSSFTTLDSNSASTRFAVFTDTHEKVSRIKEIFADIARSPVDFVVNLGDTVNYAVSEQQIKDVFLAPVAEGLNGKTPLLYARGNHEYRGSYARALGPYLKAPENSYDFVRDAGPLHLVVFDTGEDKADGTNVYAGLNDLAAYRAAQLPWFKQALAAPRVRSAPFTVLLAHQPNFGFLDGHNDDWMRAANTAHVDLFIAGHVHRFMHIKPGERGNDFPILVVGQDQVAHVEATADALKVTLNGIDGKQIDSFNLPRKHK